MKVSTRGDYASRALLSLALHTDGEGPTAVRDIAERTGLPQPYLEQILLALKGAGLVRSKRGVGGGYVLARPPEEITLSQIVSAVDGPIVAGDFGLPHENGACDHEGQCVLLTVWADLGEHMRTHLDSYNLADMVARAQGRAPALRQIGIAQSFQIVAMAHGALLGIDLLAFCEGSAAGRQTYAVGPDILVPCVYLGLGGGGAERIIAGVSGLLAQNRP